MSWIKNVTLGTKLTKSVTSFVLRSDWASVRCVPFQNKKEDFSWWLWSQGRGFIVAIEKPMTT